MIVPLIPLIITKELGVPRGTQELKMLIFAHVFSIFNLKTVGHWAGLNFN